MHKVEDKFKFSKKNINNSLRFLDVKNVGNKVFVLGIDGFDWKLLRSYIKQGHLPTFKKLLNEGAGGRLTSTIPPITACAWTSLVTGKNPGKHGIFDFFHRQKDTYNMIPINSSNWCEKSIWEIMSEENKKVVVINVPMTYPPQKVRGIMITGKLTPSEKSVFTYPSSFSSELRREGYRIEPEEVYSKNNENDFLMDVYRTLEKQTEVTLKFLKNYEWDFFMVNFDYVDEIQHFFWHYTDSRKHSSNSQKVRKCEKAILQIHQKMDEVLKEFLENLDEKTTVIVVSDHGFGPHYGLIHLNNWLIDLGLLKFKENLSSKIKFWLFKHGFSPQDIYNMLSKLRFHNLKSRTGRDGRERARFLLRKMFLSFSNVDWSRSKAYSFGISGAIFVNLRGREPEGVVEREEYEMIRNYLIEESKKLRNPKTGESLIKCVIKKESVYSGPCVDFAPDLLVVPTETYSAFGEFEFFSNSLVSSSLMTGFHRMKGVFIMRGDGVRRGMILNNINIMDVVPTILKAMKLPIPSDLDGKVPIEGFEPLYLKAHPIRYKTVRTPRTQSLKFKWTKEDEKLVKQKLKALGYLG